jgi:F-type H+-transporting ATPase subunit epsilon
MVGLLHGKFRIVLLTPKAKLLDCRCGSVVLPAHDGQLGILRNHCPMLSKVGFGIMQVHEIVDRSDAYFIINGGFVRVSENHITVLAYEVRTFEGMSQEDAERLVSEAQSVVAGQNYIRSQQDVLDQKMAKYIVHMAEMAAIRLPQPESDE